MKNLGIDPAYDNYFCTDISVNFEDFDGPLNSSTLLNYSQTPTKSPQSVT